MIKEISSLRFIFMCMIFLHHMGYYPQGGFLGVAFFFVLSGFVLTLGYKDKLLDKELSCSRFYSKRLIRLFPLHWLCFIAVFTLEAVMGKTPCYSVSRIIANVSLTQSWIPSSDYYWSFNGVSWFLSDTLFLIIAFPLLLRITAWFQKTPGRFLLLVSALLLIPSLLFILSPNEKPFYLFFIFPPARLFDFMLGICSAFFYLYLKEQTVWISKYRTALKFCLYACIPLLILISLLIPKQNLVFSLFFTPLLCIMIILTSITPVGGNTLFSWKPLVVFGGYSFEFYMVHQICIKAFEYNNHFGISRSILVLIVVFIFAAAISVLCKYLFVLPVTRKLNCLLPS